MLGHTFQQLVDIRQFQFLIGMMSHTHWLGYTLKCVLASSPGLDGFSLVPRPRWLIQLWVMDDCEAGAHKYAAKSPP